MLPTMFDVELNPFEENSAQFVSCTTRKALCDLCISLGSLPAPLHWQLCFLMAKSSEPVKSLSHLLLKSYLSRLFALSTWTLVACLSLQEDTFIYFNLSHLTCHKRSFGVAQNRPKSQNERFVRKSNVLAAVWPLWSCHYNQKQSSESSKSGHIKCPAQHPTAICFPASIQACHQH